MAEIVIAPATADRFDDAEHALTGGGDGASCQCQWWMMPDAEFQQLSTDQRRELLRNEMREETPPGLIATVAGTAAGWVRVGPRPTQPRLARTRAIAPGMQGDLEDAQVWAVTCFVVRREYRRQGLADSLLRAALSFATDAGAEALEGYPVDTDAPSTTGATERRRRPSNGLYHGTLSMFERAGFHEVARPQPHRAVVSLALSR